MKKQLRRRPSKMQPGKEKKLKKGKKREAEEKIRKEQELKEKAEKEQRDKEKVEREALKKAMKNEKKILKNTCKASDYFSTNADDKVQNLTDLDRLCEILNLEELKSLNEKMKDKSKLDCQEVFIAAVNDLNKKLEKEKYEALEGLTKVILVAKSPVHLNP